MRRRNLTICLTVALAVVLSAAFVEPVQSAGYWNMPGTHAQRAGHGYSGGYHAPLILGPVRCDGWSLGMPVRLPCAPSPYYGCGAYGDSGRMVEATSSMESFVPTTAPAVAPMPVAAAPIAAVPVETRAIAPAPATPSESVSLDPEPVVEPAVETVAEPTRPLFDPPVQQ